MTDLTEQSIERFHPAGICDKYEVLRGIYPNNRRLTGKECSCGFDKLITRYGLEQRIDEAETPLVNMMAGESDYISIEYFRQRMKQLTKQLKDMKEGQDE